MSSGKRFLELDGLRGWAVSCVLFSHMVAQKSWGPGVDAWLRPLFAFTDQGVDVFFGLSGFLISGILFANRESSELLPAFYGRRFFRIFPIYFLLILSFVAIVPLNQRFHLGLESLLDDHSALPFWRYILFTQNNVMMLDVTMNPFWMICTWSLAIEEQFYLVAPLIIKFATRRLVVALCIAAVIVCPILRFLATDVYSALFLLVTRADSLCIGVLIQCAFSHEPVKAWLGAHRRAIAGGAAVFGVAYILVGFFPPSFHMALTFRSSFYAIGTAVIMAHFILQPDSMTARVLRARPLVFVGGVSYFLYLFHWPIAACASIWFVNHMVLAMLGSAVLVFSLAVLSRDYLEQPLIQFAHRFSYRPKKGKGRRGLVGSLAPALTLEA